jgi:hypothetical protein
VEIDEYGKGAGFGLSWECPSPHLIHALLTILPQHWLARLTDPSASLPDVMTRPEKMRAVLAWFTELLPPRQFRLLDRAVLVGLKRTNRPGFGQPGTAHWHWQGSVFEAPCPPLGGKARLMLAIAMPATEPFFLPEVFPIWQTLAFLTLLGGVAGERRPDPLQKEPDEPLA